MAEEVTSHDPDETAGDEQDTTGLCDLYLGMRGTPHTAYLVWLDSQGFQTVRPYCTDKAAEQAFATAREELEEAAADED